MKKKFSKIRKFFSNERQQRIGLSALLIPDTLLE